MSMYTKLNSCALIKQATCIYTHLNIYIYIYIYEGAKSGVNGGCSNVIHPNEMIISLVLTLSIVIQKEDIINWPVFISWSPLFICLTAWQFLMLFLFHAKIWFIYILLQSKLYLQCSIEFFFKSYLSPTFFLNYLSIIFYLKMIFTVQNLIMVIKRPKI